MSVLLGSAIIKSDSLSLLVSNSVVRKEKRKKLNRIAEIGHNVTCRLFTTDYSIDYAMEYLAMYGSNKCIRVLIESTLLLSYDKHACSYYYRRGCSDYSKSSVEHWRL